MAVWLVMLLVYLFGLSSTNAEVTWPHGTYGLPKAKTGCPNSGGIQWVEGWREQDLEDDEPHRNEVSPGSHMEVQKSDGKNNMIRHFCMKAKQRLFEKQWPKGFYCIYKKRNCPDGMKKGSVLWDDEDEKNSNKKEGKLPDGIYDHNTLIEYCCQENGPWFNSVELPVDHPFYLLPHSSSNSPKCQLVKWALTSLEYIAYDTQDDGNRDELSGSHVYIEKDGPSLLKVYYCYYEGCRYRMMDHSTGSFSSPSYLSQVDGYPQFQYCSWLISVKETFVILLNFTSFSFSISDCDKHFVRVYDGLDEKAPVRATYCGLNETSESTVVSSSNNVYVVANFGSYSENAKVSSGFHVQYWARLNSTGCRYHVTGNNGTLESLMNSIPEGYPHFQSCYWLISVRAFHVVALNLTSFTDLDCSVNMVNVYDGINKTAPLLRTFCGTNDTLENYNFTVISSTNNMLLVLESGRYSNSPRIHPGFKAQYSTRLKPTEQTTTKIAHLSSPSHSPTNDTITERSTSTSFPVTYIVIPLVGVIILLLIVGIVVVFLRRRKTQGTSESTAFRGVNHSYDMRKIATVNQSDAERYATPEERLWVTGGSTLCKESQNPVYETGPVDAEASILYSSADNITYEPQVEGKTAGKSDFNRPFDEAEPTILHSSADNITYEPLVGAKTEKAKSQHPPVYDEPAPLLPNREIHYDVAESKA